MSPVQNEARLPPAALKKALYPQLFTPGEQVNTYAVLDGASIPDLLDHLYGNPRPEFICLYRGELEPDMAEVAPYLVLLKPNTPFTDWVLGEGWGRHWGIFATSKVDMAAMRKHFRTFLMVKDPDGKSIYFRYYDPRVLRIYLPTCNAQEIEAVFGPIHAYLLEDEAPAILLRFPKSAGGTRKEAVRLAG